LGTYKQLNSDPDSLQPTQTRASNGGVPSSIRQMPTHTISVRGILFDMDGVLISSTGADERCWLRWAKHHHMEGAFSLQSTHGRRALDTLRAIRPDLDPVIEQRRLEDYDAEDHSGLIILPGVEKLLASLPADRWTIVTSATVRLLEGRLGYAKLPMPAVLVSADKVANGKPHPEIARPRTGRLSGHRRLTRRRRLRQSRGLPCAGRTVVAPAIRAHRSRLVRRLTRTSHRDPPARRHHRHSSRQLGSRIAAPIKSVILNATEGGVRDLLYLPFDTGAKRRSANATALTMSGFARKICCRFVAKG
jgi:hypothetical protein